MEQVLKEKGRRRDADAEIAPARKTRNSPPPAPWVPDADKDAERVADKVSAAAAMPNPYEKHAICGIIDDTHIACF
jgi:hypothetical protein